MPKRFIDMTRTKETKGTVVYSANEDDALAIVRTVYVSKAGMQAADISSTTEKIRLHIETED